MTLTHLEFLQHRQRGIGSSDAPNLIGVGFQDAAAVYRSKVEPITPNMGEVSGYLKRGIVLEPLVAAEYSQMMDAPLEKAGFHTHPEREWQMSSPDYVRRDGKLVELKTTNSFGFAWGENGTDMVPSGYAAQTQHQMGVRGADEMHLAALNVVNWELRIYMLRFDHDYFAWLTDIESMAWEMIQRREPLSPEWSKQWQEEAEQRAAEKQFDAGSIIELSEDFIAILDRRNRLKKIVKEAESEIDAADEQLKTAVGFFDKAHVGGWKIKTCCVKAHTRPACEVDAYSYLRITPPKGSVR